MFRLSRSGYLSRPVRPIPFARLPRPPGPRLLGLLQQPERLSVARVALQDGAEVPNPFVPLPGSQQQRCQVNAERHVVGHRLDGLAETVQHGEFWFHPSVRARVGYG